MLVVTDAKSMFIRVAIENVDMYTQTCDRWLSVANLGFKDRREGGQSRICAIFELDVSPCVYVHSYLHVNTNTIEKMMQWIEDRRKKMNICCEDDKCTIYLRLALSISVKLNIKRHPCDLLTSHKPSKGAAEKNSPESNVRCQSATRHESPNVGQGTPWRLRVLRNVKYGLS